MSSEKDETWPEWPDALGQPFRPGDLIAVATVSGKSPQLVIAQVERINRMDSKGEAIVTHHWGWDGTPPEDRTQANYKRWTEPSCTVRARPIVSGRGFWREGKGDGKHRAVTYTIPGNIVRVSGPEGYQRNARRPDDCR